MLHTFPLFLKWCICFFVDFILTDCLMCNVMSFFLFVKPPPPPWDKLKMKHLFKKMHFGKKNGNKKWLFFACFAAPYVLCHRANLSICSLLKKKKKWNDKKMFPPHVTHKLLRWLICMNIEHVQVLYHYWFRGWLDIKSDYEEHVA